MEQKLTYAQQEELKNKIKAETFSMQELLASVMNLGFDEAAATKIVSNSIKDYKEELYFRLKEDKKIQERGNIAIMFTIMLSLVVSIMGKGNNILIMISIIAASIAGFIGYPKKPLAGLAGFLVGSFLMPIVAGFYLKGRDSFFTLELIIPIALSFGPALLIKYVVTRFMYNENEI